jgi:hypothetical protein
MYLLPRFAVHGLRMAVCLSRTASSLRPTTISTVVENHPYIYSTGRFEAEPDSSSGRRLSLCVIPLHPDLPSGVLALLSEQAVPVIAADVVPNTSTEPRARPV